VVVGGLMFELCFVCWRYLNSVTYSHRGVFEEGAIGQSKKKRDQKNKNYSTSYSRMISPVLTITSLTSRPERDPVFLVCMVK
jgi:hypothetical protein